MALESECRPRARDLLSWWPVRLVPPDRFLGWVFGMGFFPTKSAPGRPVKIYKGKSGPLPMITRIITSLISQWPIYKAIYKHVITPSCNEWILLDSRCSRLNLRITHLNLSWNEFTENFQCLVLWIGKTPRVVLVFQHPWNMRICEVPGFRRCKKHPLKGMNGRFWKTRGKWTVNAVFGSEALIHNFHINRDIYTPRILEVRRNCLK